MKRKVKIFTNYIIEGEVDLQWASPSKSMGGEALDGGV